MPQEIEQPTTYAQAKERLDELVVEVRKKDISLEKSLDLLEEGVRLANQCTELIDQADWETLIETEETADDEVASAAAATPEAADAVAPTETDTDSVAAEGEAE